MASVLQLDKKHKRQVEDRTTHRFHILSRLRREMHEQRNWKIWLARMCNYRDPPPLELTGEKNENKKTMKEKETVH